MPVPSGSHVIDSPASFEAWLFGFVRDRAPRGKQGLLSSAALFAALGDPQDSIPAVHVVGTAGKGTAAAAITAGLVASGERVATHLSPHVHDIRERFLLDGELPDWDLVQAAGREVAAAAATLDEPPTFFAATAAVLVVLGVAAGADRFVVEAGIGGRLDATNVFARDDVLTVVTGIGVDHTDVLGTAIGSIAAEKAAVLNGRRLAVLGPQDCPAAAAAVRSVASAAGVRLIEVERSAGSGPEASGDLRRQSSSAVERDALATANAALGALDTAGVAALPALPGRFEIVRAADRLVVLDGAHNPMKLAALRSRLDGGADPAALVVALGLGKDLSACAGELLGQPPHPLVIATEFGPPEGRPGPRGHPAARIVAAFEALGAADVHAEPDPAAAMQLAFRRTAAGDMIVVTGSFMHLSAGLAATRRWPQPG